jgi:putative acetyltransferase
MIGNHLLERQIRESSIRRIGSEDDSAIASRLAERYEVLGLEASGENDPLSQVYSAERCAYFVMERDCRIVGGAGIAPLANDLVHIADLQRLVLEPMNTRIGHGIRLLNECVEADDRLGYRSCYAESFSGDSDLNVMLRRTGFRVSGENLLKATTLGCDAIHYFKLGLR